MRYFAALVLIVTLTACSGDSADTTTTTATTSTTTTTSSTTTSTVAAIPTCVAPGFLPTVLPDDVGVGDSGVSIPLDPFTSIPGASTSVWVDGSGDISLLLIRGALPPERWIETPETITVRGTDAALGELPGGHAAVAWFEGPDRCDEYSLILYPPGDLETVREIAESLFPEE